MKSNLLSGSSLGIILCFSIVSIGFSQQTVAIGDSNPKTNAILYLKGNGSQGLIIPIVSSLGAFGEAGMVVYNSTDKKIHYHDGNSWNDIGGGAVSTDLIIGNEVSGVGNNGALILGGTGTAASPFTVSLISGTTNGQVLKWNSSTSKWELGIDNTGSLALNSAQILVGNASNVPTATTISGDATLSNTGSITIGTGAVSSAKILDGTIANSDIATAAAIAPSKIGQASATTGQVLEWNGTAWAPANDDAGSVSLNSAQILVGNASNVPTATTVSGDATLSNVGALTIGAGAVNSSKILDGTIADADIATAAAIAPAKIGQASATTGQVLEWNGTAWAPANDDAGSVSLNSGQILVGNLLNIATATTMSGDATLSAVGALTIASGAVNSAKILDGSISNIDISSTAAIAPSKIGQAAATAGQVLEWNGSSWAPATDDAGSVLLNSAQILVGNALNIPTATTVSGDASLSNTGALTIGTGAVNSAKILDGAIANADIAAAAAIAPSKLGQASAANGQVLEWNGTAWAPATDDAGISSTLANGQMIVGSAGNTAIPVTMNGDATLTNAGTVTIASDAINSAKIADASIMNVDVAAAAAIDGSKIKPDFGAQNVLTTGSLTSSALNANNTVTFSTLAGTGTRMVTADASGVLNSQPIPSASFSTLNFIPKGDGSGMVASQLYDDGTNIGIGTTSPAYLVDVHKILGSPTDANLHLYNPSAITGSKSGIRFETGSGWAVHLNTAQDGDWLQLTNNGGTTAHRWTYQSYYPGNGNAYIYGTGLDLALMGGFVGIGSTSPDRKLDISDATTQLLRLNSTTAGASMEFVSSTNNDWSVGTMSDNLVFTQSSNNFSTSSNQYFFTTSYFGPSSDGGKTLGTALARWAAVYSVNGTIQTSDLRLKDNIRKLNYGLDEVLKLRPVSYSWKSDVSSKKIGLIAQEVQKLIPEVVTEGEILGMNYAELVPVLINAIQEQQKSIERLNQKLTELSADKNSELDTLRAEIAEIKKALGVQANAKN